MVPAGNKAKRPSLVNHLQKQLIIIKSSRILRSILMCGKSDMGLHSSKEATHLQQSRKSTGQNTRINVDGEFHTFSPSSKTII